MANVIDALLITIGVDPSGVRQGVQAVDQSLKNVDATVRRTAGALAEGLKPNADTSGLQKLGAETRNAEAALREADAAARRAGDSMSDSLKKPGEAMQGTAGVFSELKGLSGRILASLSGAVAGMFNTFISQGTQLGALSKRLGRDVGEIDAWGAAVEQAGGSASAFQSTLASFDKGMRDAAVSGGGGNLEMLHLLGIQATDARGRLRSLTDIMPDLARRIEGMSNARSRTILEKMGLDDGTILLLQKGGKAVEDLTRDMRDFAFTKRDTDAAEAFGGAMAGLGRAGQSTANILFRALVPIVVRLSDAAKEFFRVLVQHEPFVLSFFAVLTAASMKFLLAWAANPVVLSILAIIAVIGALALVIDDLYAYTQGGGSRWKDFWAQFGTGEEISRKLSASWENLKEIGRGVFERLKEYVQSFFQVFDSAVSLLRPVLDVILKFGSQGEPELQKVGKVIASVISGFIASKAIIGITQSIASGIKGVTGAITGMNKASRANVLLGLLQLLLIAGWAIYDNWDDIKKKFEEWGLTAENISKSIQKWIDEYINAPLEKMVGYLEKGRQKLLEFLGLNEESKKKNQEEGLAQANLYASGAPADVSDAERRQKRENVMGQITAQLPHNYGAKQQAVSQALSRTENKISRTDVSSNVNVGTVNITAPDGDAQNIAGVFGTRMNNFIFAAQTGTIQK